MKKSPNMEEQCEIIRMGVTMKKKVVLLGMTVLMAALLGGCGKGGDKKQESVNNAAAKEHVYKAEEMTFSGLDTDTINSVFYRENNIIVYGYKWEDVEAPAVDENQPETADVVPLTEDDGLATSENEDGEEALENDTAETSEETEETGDAEKSAGAIMDMAAADEIYVEEPVTTIQKNYIASYDYEGKQLSYAEYEIPNGEWSGQMIVPESEDALYSSVESYYEDYSDPDNYVSEQRNFLVKRDFSGNEVWRVRLNEYAAEDYCYVNSVFLDEKGQIYVFVNQKLLTFSPDSELVKQVDVADENIGNIYVTDSGKVIASYWGENGQYFKNFNLETGELSEEYHIPGNSYSYSIFSGYGYDLLLDGNNALYGYNLGDEELTEIMNYIDSDLDASGVYSITGISDTEFYASFYSYTDERTCYAKFTKVPPEEVKEKKVLVLGCAYTDWDVRRQVVKFNKENEEYRIQIKDYSIYNTEEDYTQAYTQLNMDIVSGKVPDILMLNSSLPVDSYLAKGLFEDLYPFIDGDAEINRSDLLEEVLETFSTDGKLYQLIPTFSVFTLAGKASNVGTAEGWTLDELNALMETKGEGTEIFFDVIRDTVLSYSMQMSSDQFINWETGECSFDSEGFVKLLEFIKQFPAEYDNSRYEDENFWKNYDSMYRDDRALLSVTYLNNFTTYNRMEKGTFGEAITMIGFPADNRKGSALDYNLNFAMSSKSSNKDGAWQFLRYFYSYEYQKDTYGFPTNKKRYEEMKQEAMQKPFYYDENEQKVEYDDSYWIGDVEVKIPPMTAEEVQRVEDFIFSVDQTVSYDENLINIIKEEAEGFFSGQKSAKEVAGVIQSRVKIYVNENR